MLFNIHEIFVNDISQIERVLVVWNYEIKVSKSRKSIAQ